MGHGFVLFRVAPENFGDSTTLLHTEVRGVINKCRKLPSLYLLFILFIIYLYTPVSVILCRIDRALRHFSQAKQSLSKLRISKLSTLNYSYLPCSPVKHRTLLELTHLWFIQAAVYFINSHDSQIIKQQIWTRRHKHHCKNDCDKWGKLKTIKWLQHWRQTWDLLSHI